MSRFWDSLYGRLVVVFIAALVASFATMYFLFLSHLEQTRNNNFARLLATQVRLVEELLHSGADVTQASLHGIRFSAAQPAVSTVVDADLARHLPVLVRDLRNELGRDVRVVPVSGAAGGLWISLAAASAQPQWMFIPLGRHESHPGGPLLPALLVGFVVFLAGGMLLLWQIQRPLKRLAKALESVGDSTVPVPLPVSGVAEARQLSLSYNAMVGRLQRYEEDRSAMLAGVAHDLRSPITRLRLLLEIMQSERSGEMQKNLDDIERITEQFLIYARGSEGEEAEKRDLCLLAEEVVTPYADRGVQLACEQPNMLVPVCAGSLRRAVINLLENALEYGALPVTVRVCREGDTAVVAVEDAGAGIPQQQMAYAMRPFARLDGARGGKGHCGLGLGIAAQIAEAHQGGLELRNRAEGGFVATLRLPLERVG